MKNYISRERRKSIIFENALILAKKKGILKINVKEIAEMSECSISLVRNYYCGITNLRECLIKHSRENNTIMDIL